MALCLIGPEARSADPAASITLPTIRSCSQFYEVPLDQAQKGCPVRIEAVVLYGDVPWRMVFVQDPTGMLYVEIPPSGAWPDMELGDLLRVEGRTKVTNGERGWSDLRLRVVGKGTLPSAMTLGATDLLDPNRGATYARVRGIVRTFSPEDQLRLSLLVDGKPFTAWVRKYRQEDLDQLLYATVKLEGVCGHSYDDKGKVTGSVIYVANPQNLVQEKPGPANPFDLPVTPIRKLFNQPKPGTAAGTPVHTQGIVVSQVPGQSVTIEDGVDRIRLQSLSAQPLDINQRVDALGFPVEKVGERWMEDGFIRRVGKSPVLPVPNAPAPATNRNLATIEQIGKIHALSQEEAGLGIPVAITGVLTFYDRAWRGAFVQDDSGAVYVETQSPAPPMRVGQRVEVTGVTHRGGYLPMVVKPTFRVLGEGALPSPKTLNLERGREGDNDCSWVKLEGIVRWTRRAGARLEFDVANAEGAFPCILALLETPSLATNLIGAVVSLQGVARVVSTDAGGFNTYGVNVPDETKLKTLRRSEEVFATAREYSILEFVRTRASQLQSSPVKVRGVVTLNRPGSAVILQDSTGGLFVSTDETNSATVGAEVEAVGFRGRGDYRPILSRARIQVIRQVAPLEPKRLTAERLLQGTNHSELVELDARLLETVIPSKAPDLLLDSGSVLLTASLEASEASLRLPPLPAGTILRIRGVCFVNAGDQGQARSFRLLVRSPDDIQVLKRPPLLTARIALGIAGALGCGVLATLIWVTALRRRVSMQTAQIRERLEREAALEARYRLLVEQSPTAILITDTTGNIEYANRKFTELSGYTLEEVQGKRTLVMADDSSLSVPRSELWKRISGGEEWHGEQRNLRKDGSLYWIYNHICPIRNEKGEITRLLVNQEDITERRDLEMRLRQAQKMESVGQLAAGVAHDFNNLLTVIQGHATLLHTESGLPPDATESALEICTSAQRAADLTRQLLAFGRRQMIQPRPLDLNQVITNLVKMLQRLLGAHIDLNLACVPKLPTVMADQGMIEQVIVNLAVNARDAMPEGGTLTFRTRLVTLDAEQARKHPEAEPGTYVGLTVADTGTGMSPEVMAKIFDPFFTTKEVGKGTGLGLATVHGILQQHGGWIQVSSDLGRGSVFDVYLPAEGTASAGPESGAQPPPQRGRNCKVLLAEDEPGVRSMVMRVLCRQGYEVLPTKSGAEALRIWEEHQGNIDLLFTDMVMPDGVSGAELAARLLEKKPTLKVIYCSGYSADLVGMNLEVKEGVNFLQKPFTINGLLRIVETK